MILQSNIEALNTNRHLGINNKSIQKSTKKLSSGYKINEAADDAAGLNMSEKMRSLIRGLQQASDNLGDGIGYVQVADGALGEVQSMLHRMNELAVKAGNDTNDARDRQTIQSEMDQLVSEIDRTFYDTEFNKIKIWNEKIDDRVQIGVKEVVSVKVANTSLTIYMNETNKASVPAGLNGGSYKLVASMDETDPLNYGIKVKWDACNGNSYTSELIPWPDKLSGSHQFNLKNYLDTNTYPELKGLDFRYSYDITEGASLQNVFDTINGTTISCTSNPVMPLEKYTAPGETPLSGSSANINYSALLVSERDFNLPDDTFIEGITTNNKTHTPVEGTDSNGKWEFSFNMDGIGPVKATSASMSYSSSYQYGKVPNPWWYRYIHPTTGRVTDYIRTQYSSSTSGSLQEVLDALDGNANTTNGLSLIDDNDTTIGGTIQLNFDLTADNAFNIPGTTSSTRTVGSLSFTVSVSGTDTRQDIIDRINGLLGFDIYSKSGGAATSVSKSSHVYSSNGPKIQLPVWKGIKNLNIQAGASEGHSLQIRYDNMNKFVLGIDDIDVSTHAKSGETLDKIANALDLVSDERSIFGSYQNRMSYSQSNADNSAENTQATESRIRDTDMADEMVKYSKSNILMQAGQSLLAQSNRSKEGILNLLQ